jgi:hypothetical protein
VLGYASQSDSKISRYPFEVDTSLIFDKTILENCSAFKASWKVSKLPLYSSFKVAVMFAVLKCDSKSAFRIELCLQMFNKVVPSNEEMKTPFSNSFIVSTFFKLPFR